MTNRILEVLRLLINQKEMENIISFGDMVPLAVIQVI